MVHSRPTTPSSAKGTSGVTALRDLLSSVAHQVESHLHPHPPSVSSWHHHSDNDKEEQVKGRQRRPSRIRSWIGSHEKHKERETDNAADSRSDGGDWDSLHLTDASDEDLSHSTSATKSVSHRDSKAHRDDSEIRATSRSTDTTNKGQPTSTHDLHNSIALVVSGTAVAHAHASAKMHSFAADDKEEEMVGVLTSLMGDGFDHEIARRILRKYDGNVEKAAGALLEGERGEELVVGSSGSAAAAPIQIQSQGWPPIGTSTAWPMTGTGAGSMQSSSQAPQTRLEVAPSELARRPNTPVIDLTNDDDLDLQRAVQESMNSLHAGSQSQMQAFGPASQSQSHIQGQAQTQAQTGPVFGPSNRSPDPNWAIVPSHQNENNDANYLHNLNRAIEASLETMGDSDALEPFPVEQQLRRDGCPVVLRPSLHTMVYAASILQGLFYVPQVRQRMACWRPPVSMDEDEAAPPMNGPDFTLWALSEIFTHMDLARLCDLNVDKRLPAFHIDPWGRPTQPPGELSRKFFAKLSATLERSFIEQFAHSGQLPPKPRLLHFQYGIGASEPGGLFLQETSIVPIDVNGGESNDLIGRLSAQLSKPQSEPGKQCVIFEPSEVVAFELVRNSSTANAAAGGSGSERKVFTYPKSIYLDQFLKENVELAQAKREQRRQMLEEVQRLVLQKKTLTHFDGKDTLKDLRSTIFYFENVAGAGSDPERGASIQATTRKLKGILTTIEEEIKATDEKIDMLHSRAETLLDCEELQQFKYDLRVVFVHDGLYGRKHLYSYVHDRLCWWKIADSLIEKVSEELVLTDQAGLHLGAGPYMLLYSRAVSEGDGPASPLPWMDDIKDDVKAANREFLSQLPPELVSDIVIDEEDVSEASVLSSGHARVKNASAVDGMDMS